MNLNAMTIPDDQTALARWIEQQLASGQLAALAVELAVIHRARHQPAVSLDQVLGGARAEVLEHGLERLPKEALTQLLVHPDLLVELQSQITVSGGKYWETLPVDDALQGSYERGRARYIEWLERQEGALPSAGHAVAVRRKAAWYQRPAVLTLAMAACLVIGVTLGDRFSPFAPARRAAPTVAWGWARPGALEAHGDRAAYLRTLAATAGQWFNARPTQSAPLARRLAEFRQGCSALIFAEHRPLTADDRQWLVEKCRGWAAKLDRHLADLEAGQSALEIRDQADATVRQLMKALDARAT